MTYAKPGRASVKVRVAHVEDQPCPRRPFGEHHELINFGETVRCDYCARTWAELDAELRGGAA